MSVIIDVLQLLGAVSRWHGREALRLRNSVLAAMIIPLVLILAGGFAGVGGMQWKLAALDTALLVALASLLFLGWRRALIGTEVSAVLRYGYTYRQQQRGTSQMAAEAVKAYIEFAAAVVTSEMAVGFAVLFVPLHRNPAAAVMAMLAGLALAFWSIWRGGPSLWPKIAFALIVATLIVTLLMIFYPSDQILQPALGGEAAPHAAWLLPPSPWWSSPQAQVLGFFLAAAVIIGGLLLWQTSKKKAVTVSTGITLAAAKESEKGSQFYVTLAVGAGVLITVGLMAIALDSPGDALRALMPAAIFLALIPIARWRMDGLEMVVGLGIVALVGWVAFWLITHVPWSPFHLPH